MRGEMAFASGKRDLTWMIRRWPSPVRGIIRRVLPRATFRRYLTRHEDESLRLWKQLSSRVPIGGVILDIGAYHGEYALSAKAANPAAIVCAFEPDATAFEALSAACKSTDVEAIPAAVGDKEQMVCFGEHRGGQFSGIMSPYTRSLNGEFRSYEVRQIALDAWCSEREYVPGLLKIDVEGAESLVLNGATGLIRRHGPPIICEVLTDAAGESVMEALPEFYRYYQINELGGLKGSDSIRRLSFRNRNWLLLPEAQSAAVRTRRR